MKRYICRRAFEDWEADALDSLPRTVHEPDPSPQPTGILDKHGNELFSISELGPIGFIRFPRGTGE